MTVTLVRLVWCRLFGGCTSATVSARKWTRKDLIGKSLEQGEVKSGGRKASQSVGNVGHHCGQANHDTEEEICLPWLRCPGPLVIA